MMQSMMTFQDAAIGAVAVSLVAGIIATVKSVATMTREVRSLGHSMRAVYTMQPFMIKAMRHNNESFKALGANGSTTKSDECLDEAEKCLDRRLAERVGGCA